MGTLVVLKEIEDAILLHQTGNKVESGLAILDDVFALRVTGLGAVLKILKAVVLKNFLNDVGDRFLLENLAIGGAREEPEPGDDFSAVIAEAVVAAYASKTGDKTIPMALVVTRVMKTKGHLFSHNILVPNGVLLGQKVDRKMK